MLVFFRGVRAVKQSGSRFIDSRLGPNARFDFEHFNRKEPTLKWEQCDISYVSLLPLNFDVF